MMMMMMGLRGSNRHLQVITSQIMTSCEERKYTKNVLETSVANRLDTAKIC